jgi:hypothetical protein
MTGPGDFASDQPCNSDGARGFVCVAALVYTVDAIDCEDTL